MPRKQWGTFEKLAAADVNTYLSDQAVMRFASAAARTTAIPSPVEGMVSWLNDTNALQVYDGSSWVDVSAGVAAPNPLAGGDLGDVGMLYTTSTSASSTWVTLSSGLASNSVIFAAYAPTTGFGISQGFELATGGVGSEVIRWSFADTSGGGWLGPLSWPVYVPAGKRIAFRYCNTAGLALFHYPVGSGTEVEFGSVLLNMANSTAWQQVAATPPKAGGVEIVGVATIAQYAQRVRIGFGAAASETAASQHLFYDRCPQAITPITWAAGTRLAAQKLTSTGLHGLRVFWRESLA